MVPEIFPRVFGNEYKLKSPKPNDKVMSFIERNFVCKIEDEKVLIPTVSDFGNDNLLYLFCIDDTSYFLWQGDTSFIPNGYEKKSLQEIRSIGDTFNYLEIFTARHLSVWYSDNKYCGRCGRPTKIGTKERNLLCECGNMIFPKIMPAVIVGVRNKNKLLMTKYANRPYTNWALIAGFVEIGETVEETVKREVKEEVGIDVKNITYYASQPWGIDQDLLLGYFCDVDGDDYVNVDKNELSIGQWFNRDEVPERTNLQSLTATMMEAFRRGKDKEPYGSL